ncbi:MAG: class I SAM-dependent methyltransferase [Pyrinomonadaceae bacterium]
MDEHDEKRENARRIAAEFAARGDSLGWFEALYKESAGDNEHIPWADLEPNRYFKAWAEEHDLKGGGRTALVVGCGLGDDARYLHDLGFTVTGFDISPTAIEWAKRLHADTDIVFEIADLFKPSEEWIGAFDFVLEVYTIQPLPLAMRSAVVDAIAAFVGDGGQLVVVTRGREDDEEPPEMPWAMSRRDLSRFADNGLRESGFAVMSADTEDEPARFVVEYTRN